MSPVPIILAALASAGRSGGGESTVENVCPPVGSSATVAKNANAVFHPGIYSGWDMVGGGGTSPDSFDGIENSFVGPDGIAYVATISKTSPSPRLLSSWHQCVPMLVVRTGAGATGAQYADIGRLAIEITA